MRELRSKDPVKGLTSQLEFMDFRIGVEFTQFVKERVRVVVREIEIRDINRRIRITSLTVREKKGEESDTR